MSRLFETTWIKGMTLANRFVRSATWEGMATEEGACTPRLVDRMVELAKGQVGLIISSHAYVRRDGQAGSWQLGIYKDELVEGLLGMTRAVHEAGGKIAVQIAHAGFFANPKFSGQTPVAPSHVDGFAQSRRKEMSVEEIQGIVEAYGAAARRAKEAGFDAIQIHAAHGYLLSQFLSPLFNRRNDAYGGPVEKRAKALVEALRGVRSNVGDAFPILVKMNCGDFLEGGLDMEDALSIGAILQEAGIDAIELSGGTLVSGKLSPSRLGINKEEKEAYFREAARAFKQRLSVPLILVGGIRSFQVAEKVIEEGVADYISMSRPFIREPDLVRRWASGDLRKAACISDNRCFEPGMAGEGVRCVHLESRP